MCQYNIRTGEREKKKKKKGIKTSVLLFVFSLVYLVWGSLVYNIYHHVFRIIFWGIGEKKADFKKKKVNLTKQKTCHVVPASSGLVLIS